MADKRGVFRVNYYEVNQPKSILVCAYTDVEAVAFVGAQAVSGVSAVRVLYPVEVSGVDEQHDAIAPQEVTKAPFDLPKAISRDDFNVLQAQLDALTEQMNLKNTPAVAAPTILPDQPAASGTNPEKE